MKASEVPQDDANLLEGKTRLIRYAVNENGEYVQVNTVGWEPENVALEQAWDIIHDKVEAARQSVIKGELSPIAYYMELNQFDLTLMKEYTGFWGWTLRRHLKPDVFKGLSSKDLEKYASIFRITVQELCNVPVK